MIQNHRLDKLTGPAGVFAGYCIMAAGIVTAYFHPSALIIAMAGMFMAFTHDGTIIDKTTGRIKNYTCLFGLFRIGKWHNANEFTRFCIRKSNRIYTAYSRASLPLTLQERDIRLILSNNDGSLKVTVNKFISFEKARKEMSDLIRDLKMNDLKEWV